MRIRTGLVAAALALGMSGCGAGDDGGDKVATAGGAGGTTTSAPAERKGDMVKFTQCMRDHGVDMPDMPDDGTGKIQLKIPEGSDRQKVDAAMAECRQHMPGGGEPPKLDPEQAERQRKMAQCMRENGVPEFPDPEPNGGIRIEMKPGSGLDPNSPQFKAAQQACAQFQPEGPGPRNRTQG